MLKGTGTNNAVSEADDLFKNELVTSGMEEAVADALVRYYATLRSTNYASMLSMYNTTQSEGKGDLDLEKLAKKVKSGTK